MHSGRAWGFAPEPDEDRPSIRSPSASGARISEVVLLLGGSGYDAEFVFSLDPIMTGPLTK
ncbi:MAG: hypothetical protein M3305_12840 [Actinomycetota bacterium]|nr:hypothetical protein [Actinomycetota bacterium]